MKVGYIRVSTEEQNTARQEVLMGQLGVEKIYIDKMSGKGKERPIALPQITAHSHKSETTQCSLIC